MHIPTIYRPGSSIDLPDHEEANDALDLVYLIEASLIDAALSLDLFEQVRAEPRGTSGLRQAVERRRPFVHARTFLYSLDTITKATRRLSKQSNLQTKLSTAIQEWKQNFPHLEDIRDSSHHMDERVLGKAREADIKALPFATANVKSAGAALFVDMLENNTYGSTTRDGIYATVDVTPASLELATQHVQRVVDALPWTGEPMVYL